MPTCFGGYALLFSNIAELGWIYFYLDVQRRHRMQRARSASEQLDALACWG